MPAPNELMNKRFEKAKMGGYKAADVDSFMVEIAGEFSRLSRENADLKRRLENDEAKIREYEEQAGSLSQALLNAQHLADNILKDAKTKSELTLRDAEIKAERIVERAKEATVGEQEHFDRIKAEVDRFRSGLLKLYKTHLELITEIPTLPKEAASPEDAAAPQQDAAEGQDVPADGGAVMAEKSVPDAEAPQPVPADAQVKADAAAAEQTAVKPPEAAVQEEAPSAAPESAAFAETQAETAAAQQEPEVRLKLKYNEKSGEYLPLDHPDGPGDGDALHFGRRR